MPLTDILTQTTARHGLIVPGDRVMVAVSGGPDSLSLLHALHAIQSEFGLADLQAAHLDHRLRGDDSAADAAFVAAFCAERNIPCHIGSADVTALVRERKLSVQQAARTLRYQFLDETANAINADKIATGHTQDDQTETVLLNILRGSGLDGLRGIPRQRGRFIRPLLDVSRAEVTAYVTANGLSPRLDASNLAADHYTRNRLRLELLPQLARDYNPGVRQALLRLSQIAARDADYIAQQAHSALADVTMTKDASQWVLDRNKLLALHPGLLRHALRTALAQFRGTSESITHEHLEPLCEAITGQHHLPFGLTTTPPYCAVRVTPRRVTLKHRDDL
ncbi:MAG: tRNA lysidine(34) synthetase TilS [Armatimonadota bacterium]|nr:tRNA lysidine(34) synthetase TilS [Armatimonadota bacterium]